MKKQEYAEQSSNQRVSSLNMDRREFFKRIGILSGGIVVYVSLGDPSSRARGVNDFNAFLRIGTDTPQVFAGLMPNRAIPATFSGLASDFIFRMISSYCILP